MDEHHPAKSMMPQAMWGLIAIIALTVALVILWSPWDDDSSGPGQGGSDTPVPGQVAQPTPPLAGTPNP